MLNKIKWLWKFYRHYPGVVAILLILTPLQSMIQVTMPRLLGFSIDYSRSGELSDHWLARSVIDIANYFGFEPTTGFALVYIVGGFFSFGLYAYFQSWRAWMNCRSEWFFRQQSFDDITSKGPNFFNKFRTGDLITRLTDDVAEKLSWFACSGIFRFYEALLAVSFIVGMMLSIDPALTLWTAGPFPALIIIFFASSSLLDKRYDLLQASISKFNDVMESCFSGVRVVKAYVREKAQKKKFMETAVARRQNEINAIRVTTLVDSLYGYIWQLGVVIVLLAGGYRVLYSDLTIGSMATFIYYVVWLVFPMFDIGQFLVKSRQSAVSINRLQELENVPPMIKDNEVNPPQAVVRGRLSFENIDLSFDGATQKIIDNVSFEVGAGKTVALVGKVGSGKTWLINMVPRLVDPTSGKVKLDGVELRDYPVAELRKMIGYVPQEPSLFSDSIRNNILFGRPEIPETILEWAIEVAQLKDDIASFPKGLETEIGTRGVSISGGQKQRLGLARALVGKPKVLILDDCTSALDARTETDLWNRLHQVLPDMTAIIITHRPDTLEKVDMIYVTENGKIVESGTHIELMKKSGDYARIYRRYQLEEQVSA